MTPALRCPTCSTETGADDAFCGGCGSPVPRRAAPASAPAAAPVPAPRRPADDRGAGPDLERVAALADALPAFPAHAALSAPGPMCPACGGDVDRVAPRCPRCGEAALVLPPRWMWAVGGVHRVRRGLRQRLGICVRTGSDGHTLLLPDGTTALVDAADPLVEPPLAREHFEGLRSSPGLLLRYAAAAGQHVGLPGWPTEALVEAAVSLAVSDRVLARLTALDALTLDRPDLVERLGLPAGEAHWLLLVHAARRGDAIAVVDHASALPAGQYRSTVGVLAAMLPAVRRVPGAASRLGPLLAGLSAREPLAGMVARALGAAPTDDAGRRHDADLRARRYPMPAPVREEVVSLLAPGRGPARPPALFGRGSRRLFARLHPEASAGLLGPEDLETPDVAWLDDVVDAGLVGRDLLAAVRPGPARAHLRARLDPAALEPDELDAHPDERRRRALREGTPGDDDGGGRLAALGALRDGRFDDVVVDDLDAGDRPVVRALLAGRVDHAALIDDALLRDRTLWPAVAAVLDGDRDVVDDAARRRVPGFAAWLDLLDARDHLYLARWSQAVTAARRCLATSGEEAVRDEALNLLACALHHLGDAPAAVAALEKAIEGDYSPALLANLAVISAELSPEAAAGHLARIVREASRPALRRHAALLALRMWRRDEHTWDGGDDDRVLPPVLRGSLRAVVVEDMPAEDFREIALALARRDADWVTTPGVLDRSPHAGGWNARFAVAFARGWSAQVDLLASVADWTQVPDWLVVERDGLAELVWDDLTDDPDDANNPTIAVCRALVTTVTGLPERLGLLLSLLSVAMSSLSLIGHEETPVPDDVLDLWRSTRERTRTHGGDAGVAEIDELATRRLATVVGARLERRGQQAIDDYNEWLERVQRTIHYHNQAMDVFQRSVDELERVQRELREWRTVTDHPDVRKMYDIALATVGGAIPHISRMILPKMDFLR